ncbi:MAG: hypothetical protein OEZ39_04145 [Gammaproteobacteria bacterium]|nr:hypothetical protein [Gammaproteobacteria bacterium]MDH5651049.1 hypothetical protein [Gammaproteobacteria bacterium]
MKPQKIFPILFLALLVSCDIGEKLDELKDTAKDITTETLATLDDAISALSGESAAWQDVLTNTISKLTDEAQATVRNEVSSVLSRAIAKTGVELRCEVDFIRNRVKDALIRIKLKFLGKPVPPLEPKFCNIDPEAVDREAVPKHIKSLNFYGYDFDVDQQIKVLLESDNGSKADVSRFLDKPTHYAMTLKFGGNGVQLNAKSRRFILQWKNQVISTIGVIQPQTPVCESKTETVRVSPITYIPPHTRGDTEYKGHGPKVTSSVRWVVSPKRLDASITMHAAETKKDWTTASGTKLFPNLFVPDPGWRIDSVVGSLSSSHAYTDTNHTEDRYQLGSGGPARELVYVGDTKGKEAGTRTQVTVYFNNPRLVLVQDKNCVSGSQVAAMKKKGTISNKSLQRLSPAMVKDLQKINKVFKVTP